MGEPVFVSWRDFWVFRNAVCSSSRYFWTAEVHDFLAAVLASSARHCANWRAGQVLYRAQLGHDWRQGSEGEPDRLPTAYPPKRMYPMVDSASEGRANPKGIPYLYLATNEDTAMAEVRPWAGSLVSLGSFLTTRDIRMVQLPPKKRRPSVLSR